MVVREMISDFELSKGPAVGGPVVWVPVEDRNLDELPERLCPIGGCPECSSVWVSYSAVGFSVGRFEGAQIGGAFDAERFVVRPMFYNVCAVSAVRLACADGHLVEFDGRTLKPVPLWASSAVSAAVLGIAGYIAGAYMFPFMRSL
jgi:hypothetical protein